jgi:hypothetical protein
MKSAYWLLIIMRSMGKVRTLRVERRTLMILGVGGLFFAGSLAFFGYEYFSFLQARRHLTGKVQELKNRIGVLEKTIEKAAMEKTLLKAGIPPVAIRELKISRRSKRGGFSVAFQLMNQNPLQQAVSGTLVLVAKNDQLRNPVYRAIPEMRLNQGIPQEPEKGKSFRVEKQKFIEALFDASSGETFKLLTVFVYSQEGKLILEKAIDLPTS